MTPAPSSPAIGIEPGEGEIGRGDQRRDRQQRGDGIGKHVNVGGAEIVVGMMGMIVVSGMIMGMIVIMVVMVVVIIIAIMGLLVAVMVMIMQEQRADEVHDEADKRDRDRFPERDRHGMDQAGHRFISDQQRHHGEDDGAGKGGKLSQLAGSERKPVIADMAAGKAVGDGGDRQRGDVGGHMEAVGDEGHRPRPRAAADFDDHHHRGQRHHRPGAPLMDAMPGAEEGVVMPPAFERIRVHRQVPAISLSRSGTAGAPAHCHPSSPGFRA